MTAVDDYCSSYIEIGTPLQPPSANNAFHWAAFAIKILSLIALVIDIIVIGSVTNPIFYVCLLTYGIGDMLFLLARFVQNEHR